MLHKAKTVNAPPFRCEFATGADPLQTIIAAALGTRGRSLKIFNSKLAAKFRDLSRNLAEAIFLFNLSFKFKNSIKARC